MREALLPLITHARALRHLAFKANSQTTGTFDGLALSFPLLQSVILPFPDDKLGLEARVENTVASFLACPEMRKLIVLSDSDWKGVQGHVDRSYELMETIAKLCRRVPSRQKREMHVNVLGYQFLPVRGWTPEWNVAL